MVLLVAGFGSFDVSWSIYFTRQLGFRLHEVLIVVIMLSSIMCSHHFQSRLTVIISMGLVGYSTALIFLFLALPMYL